MTESEPIRVLIVEDDPDQCMMLCDALEMEGLVCCGQVHNGEDAFEAIQRLKPTAMILDLVMPQMDGMALLAKMHDLPKIYHPYIFVMSVYNNSYYTQKAIQLGADRYFIKPYNLHLLAEQIRSIVLEKALPAQVGCDISQALTDLCIVPSTHGFGYMQEAVAILKNNGDRPCIFSKDVYEPIAANNATSSLCVEKAIRHSIAQAFAADTKALHSFLESVNMQDKKHMSNSVFLKLFAKWI